LSENERVVSAERGSPVKKLVVVLSDIGGQYRGEKCGVYKVHTLKVLQQICNGLSLVFQEQRFI
jgi:hypothetical protein